MNIVLIGYRCCGKTSAGKKIAEKLNRKFFDTDDLIVENTRINIDKIISAYGWKFFREKEMEIVKNVASKDELVIATGGGVVTQKSNIVNLKKNSFITWLHADIDIIKERMKKDKASGDNRPSLTGKNPIDEIKKVMEIRKPLYESAADMSIDTSKMDINSVVEKIINNFDLIPKETKWQETHSEKYSE